jgi:hypothetical protein
MISFSELCRLADQSGTATPILQQACAFPRVAADLGPLPEPALDSALDSSWEALLGYQMPGENTDS